MPVYRIAWHDVESYDDILFYSDKELTKEEFEKIVFSVYKKLFDWMMKKGEWFVEFALSDEELKFFIKEMEKHGFKCYDPITIHLPWNTRMTFTKKEFKEMQELLDKIGGKGYWKKVFEYNAKIEKEFEEAEEEWVKK